MSWDHPPDRSSNDCHSPSGYAWATWEGEDNRRVSIWAHGDRIAAVRWYAYDAPMLVDDFENVNTGVGRCSPKTARSKMVHWDDRPDLGILESLETQEERDAQWDWLWNMEPIRAKQTDIC